ncbi:hypothetical protein AAFF_G00316120 [Aldrovandia affinis]|uniref:Uncharacterized protein n=1 Tax=Aldrovandia affinis TaxID=143900 RepID=A0AAD7SMX4_9TELE|nr:hypothetical protein AAFF_G00316120 [Aldrovandia affinis]
MVSVFATKFDLNVDADTLSDYLKEKLGREVKCRKIEMAQSRFSSFCVTAECNDVAEMYDPQLWPAGSFVRRLLRASSPQRSGRRPVRTRGNPSPSGNWASARW